MAAEFEHAADARAALRTIVSDPAHGPDALDDTQVTANLLRDLLPDAPRETGLLVAASGAGLGSMLRGHAGRGMDVGTAISLAASALASRTAFAPDACRWAATELAIALGLAPAGQLPVHEPPQLPGLPAPQHPATQTEGAPAAGRLSEQQTEAPALARRRDQATDLVGEPGARPAGVKIAIAAAAAAVVAIIAAVVSVTLLVGRSTPGSMGLGHGGRTTAPASSAPPASSHASGPGPSSMPSTYSPAAAPVLSLGAPFGRALPGTARVAVPRAVSGGPVDGCPYSDACTYTVSGWHSGQPEHEYVNYDCYNLSSEYGTRVIANNQFGGAAVIGYKHYNCGGPAWLIPGGYYAIVSITPINSISLNP